jgi:hypothetical protein
MDTLREPYFGWIGSDDFFTSKTDFAEVCHAFNENGIDCYLYDLIFVDKSGPKRRTNAIQPTRMSMHLGRHIQHFSSFWRTSTIGDLRFDLKYKIAADNLFFFELCYGKHLKAELKHEVGTIARLGGYSSKDFRRALQGNKQVYDIARTYMNPVLVAFAMTCRVMRKVTSKFTIGECEVIEEMTNLFAKM